MAQCSNPIGCQMAKREECLCDCRGANHGRLRLRLADSNPEVAAQAQQELVDLRITQAKLKKDKSKTRRLRRTTLKSTKVASNHSEED